MELSGDTALSWDEVAERLEGAKYYWLHTTGPDGTPNASPMWGVVVGGTLYFNTPSSTVKARNVAHNPRVAVHLESAAEVVIVHGALEHLGIPGGRPDVLDAFAAKYVLPEELPFLPSEDPGFDVLYALRPSRAITWSLPDTEASSRRWSRT